MVYCLVGDCRYHGGAEGNCGPLQRRTKRTSHIQKRASSISTDLSHRSRNPARLKKQGDADDPDTGAHHSFLHHNNPNTLPTRVPATSPELPWRK